MAGTHPLDPWMGQGQGQSTEYGVHVHVQMDCRLGDVLPPNSWYIQGPLGFSGFCDTDSWIQTAWTYRFSGS